MSIKGKYIGTKQHAIIIYVNVHISDCVIDRNYCSSKLQNMCAFDCKPILISVVVSQVRETAIVFVAASASKKQQRNMGESKKKKKKNKNQTPLNSAMYII